MGKRMSGRFGLLLVLSLLVSACGGAQPSAPAAPAPAKPATAAPAPAPAPDIVLGLADTVTGPVASLGISSRNGATMAVDAINQAGGVGGRKIKLLFEDTGASNESAITAVERMLSQKPDAMLGLSFSTQAFAAMPKITEKKLPLISFGTNPKVAETGGEYVFTGLSNVLSLTPAAAQFAVKDLKKTKVAVMSTDDEFGVSAREQLVASLKALGANPIAVETLPQKALDATPQLLKIKQSGADAVIFWLLQNLIPVVFQQRKQLGVDSIPLVSSLILPQTLQQVDASHVDGTYGVTGANLGGDTRPAVKDLTAKYKDRFKIDMDEYAAGAYDIVHIYAEGFKTAKTPDDMKNFLKNLKGYQGMLGSYSADARRALARRATITIYKGKTVSNVSQIELQ